MDRLRNWGKSLAESTSKLAEQTKQKVGQLKKTLQLEEIIEITPRVLWMEYPRQIEKLGNHLNQKYGPHYYIWNVGERSFASEWFGNQVAQHPHQGYPCPPLIELLTIIKNMLYWLSSDDANIVVVCCQETRGRSILVISSLLSVMGGGHPGDCLMRVCELTNTKDYHALFPSQHLYLTLVGNLIAGLKMNSQCLRLISIVFSEIPTIQNSETLTPYIQLYKNGKIIFNSLTDGLQTYSSKDTCMFETRGLELSDDILVRCKHFQNNETRIALFRVMFNCSFLFDNIFRLSLRDLDKSSQFKASDNFFIDFIFERGNQKSFQTADQPSNFSLDNKSSNALIQQIIQDCRGIILREPKVALGLSIQKNESPSQVFSIGHENEQEEQEIKENIQESNKQTVEKIQQPISPQTIQSIKQEEPELHDLDEPGEEQSEQTNIVSQILSNLKHNEDEEDEDIDEYLNQLEQQ